MPQTRERSARVANLLGATALAVGDRLRGVTEDAAARGAAAPAALVTLAHHPGRPVDALARSLGLTHSGAVRLVDRLVADGLVQRRPGADGRTRALVLTARGRHACSALLDARERALREVLEPLDPEEVDALGSALEALLAGLVQEAGSGRRICRLCDEDACEGAGLECPVSVLRRDG